MPDEKNTGTDESQIENTGTDEQVSTDTGSNEGGVTEEQKAKDQEAVRKAEMDKVPPWIKEKLQKEAKEGVTEEVKKEITAQNDKLAYDTELPKVIKNNRLNEEQQKALTDEVDKLRKYQVDGVSMTYAKALSLAAKSFGGSGEVMEKAVQIARSGLPPQGDNSNTPFYKMSNVQYEKMGKKERDEYKEQSMKLYDGEVKFT